MLMLKQIHYRGIIVSSQRCIQVHPSRAAHKTVTETVGELADKVNKSVGKGLADAIDKGEKAAYMTKDRIASSTKEEKRAKQEGRQSETSKKAK